MIRKTASAVLLRGALAVVAVVSDVVISRGFEPSNRGVYAVLVSSAALLSTVGEMGQGYYLNLVGHRRPDELPKRTSEAVVLSGAFAAVVGLLAYVVARLAGVAAFSEGGAIVGLVAFCALVVGYSLLTTSSALALTKGLTTDALAGRLISRLGVLVGAVIIFAAGLKSPVVLIAISGLMGLVVALVLLVRSGWYGRLSIRFSRAAIRYGVSALPIRISERALSRLDVVVLGTMAPNPIVAQYAVALAISDALFIIGGAVGQVLQGHSVHEAPEVYFAATRKLMIAMVPGALILGITQWYLVPRLYGVGYEQVPGLVLLLLPGTVAVVLCWSVQPLLNQRGLVGRMSASYLASAFVSVGMLLVLYPVWGLTGAAVASTIGNACAAGLLWNRYRIERQKLRAECLD